MVYGGWVCYLNETDLWCKEVVCIILLKQGGIK